MPRSDSARRLAFRRLLAETGKTLRIGAPIVAAQLVQMSMSFTDTLMAGRLSAKALAAVAVGGSLFITILLFSMGVMMAVSPVVAHLHGAGRSRETGRNLWSALWLSQFMAIPGIFLIRNMVTVMQLFHIKPELIPLAQGYLDAFSWGVPAAFAYFALRFFNEGLAITKPAMYFALIGLAVNIAGNWTFMYGHFGFPAMGAIGTGWATALVQWVMLCCMLRFTFRREMDRAFNLFASFHWPRLVYQKELLAIGVPNGASMSIEVTMFATVALIMGSLGVKTVAAHQVTINFSAFTFMIPLGISFASTARVGFAAGRGDMHLARLLGGIGMGLSCIIMCATALLMITSPGLIVGIYTSDPEVKKLATSLLMLAGFFQISDGLQVAGFGALRGLKDTRVPMLINIVAYWVVGLPLGYLLGVESGLGARGLWVGLIAGLSVAAVLHNWRFYVLTRPEQEG